MLRWESQMTSVTMTTSKLGIKIKRPSIEASSSVRTHNWPQQRRATLWLTSAEAQSAATTTLRLAGQEKSSTVAVVKTPCQTARLTLTRWISIEKRRPVSIRSSSVRPAIWIGSKTKGEGLKVSSVWLSRLNLREILRRSRVWFDRLMRLASHYPCLASMSSSYLSWWQAHTIKVWSLWSKLSLT